MASEVDIAELFKLGGVYRDIEGSNAEEVFKSVCSKISLPAEISSEQFFRELLAREAVLSTAVGDGISIPHAQHPIIKEPSSQRIYVCYLKEPIDMNAMDSKKISVMLIILTCSVQSHLLVTSNLAKLLRDKNFRNALHLKVDLHELLPFMMRY